MYSRTPWEAVDCPVDYPGETHKVTVCLADLLILIIAVDVVRKTYSK